MQPTLSDPERGRRVVGGVLYGLALLLGGALLLALFLLPALMARHPWPRLTAMGVGALLAFIPLLFYMSIPPAHRSVRSGALVVPRSRAPLARLAACGFAAAMNTMVEWGLAQLIPPTTAQAITACVCAPFVEEFWKGLGVLGVFYFLRREFDGVVDGVLYATFTALGFAAVENVTYYAAADLSHHHSALAGTFLIRGVLAPWGHPLYTSMTGLGFGICARPPAPGCAGARRSWGTGARSSCTRSGTRPPSSRGCCSS